jgi:ATP adenylyltransferase
MIVPAAHTGDLAFLAREDHAELLGLCASSIRILQDALHAEGFNCGFNIGQAGGAGVKDHVHLHVVPRWCGDANFLPIIGGARSMPEYLEATYDRLIGGFEKLKAEGVRPKA